MAGAVQTARALGPGHTIVTILCDSGHKYASRLFNRGWLEGKGLAAAATEPPASTRAPVPVAVTPEHHETSV